MQALYNAYLLVIWEEIYWTRAESKKLKAETLNWKPQKIIEDG